MSFQNFGVEELRDYNQKSIFYYPIPDTDKPEPKRFEDKKLITKVLK